MKYIAIIDTDEFEDFEFLEDAEGKFLIAKDKKAIYDEWIPLYFEPFNQQKDNSENRQCSFCESHEQGDTLYESSSWDGGIGFDYIRNIKYCPLCGKKLKGGD